MVPETLGVDRVANFGTEVVLLCPHRRPGRALPEEIRPVAHMRHHRHADGRLRVSEAGRRPGSSPKTTARTPAASPTTAPTVASTLPGLNRRRSSPLGPAVTSPPPPAPGLRRPFRRWLRSGWPAVRLRQEYSPARASSPPSLSPPASSSPPGVTSSGTPRTRRSKARRASGSTSATCRTSCRQRPTP